MRNASRKFSIGRSNKCEQPSPLLFKGQSPGLPIKAPELTSLFGVSDQNGLITEIYKE